MKQVFCKDLEDAVVFYHECHRDKDVKLVKFVANPRGDTLILVRFVNEAGVKTSSLDRYIWDYVYDRWDISDPLYTDRKREKIMVDNYIGKCEGLYDD